MKPSELREKSDADLGKELIELRRERFNLRMQAATGALEGSHQFRTIRRSIARIKTIQRERAATANKG
ncbi:MAG: 50S ribosomal protein L29 [Salinisphaeraceae bacterium]|uniref:Large ribosomal subunit protein uL29 n=2 Tax=Spectribacter TaxID=3160928 RepID=A0ABU3C3K5_9GAMM|nr:MULTISPECIES: 50S ribosomal protein L29 [unclassified Salinisphaera]MDT0619358.1 50S ribosomal protein L29 [Salinisphaera sp. P385]MDT0636135.1 50S ribosomal protein L29 [Salinisphaera sp. W335]